jgi:hypothetical protein
MTSKTMTRQEFDKKVGGQGAQALDLIWGSIWAVMSLVSLICMFAAPHGLWPGLVAVAGFTWLAWRRLHEAYLRKMLWALRDAGELTFDDEDAPHA